MKHCKLAKKQQNYGHQQHLVRSLLFPAVSSCLLAVRLESLETMQQKCQGYL